jgi:chemotaxis protein MotB
VSAAQSDGAKPAAPPVIIKKIKKIGHGGHHGGAWKVAYADMVTALMALFIVLWILSQSEEIIRAVAGYFRDPVGFTEGGRIVVSDTGERSGGADGDESQTDTDEAAQSATADAADEQWEEQAERIRDAVFEGTGLAQFEAQVQIAMTPEGLSITLLETSDGPLFEVGGTNLNATAAALLQAMAGEIAKTGSFITIEGHTDALPFIGRGSTNWELSTGRALTARRILVQAGLPEARTFEVRGLADRLLYDPLDPESSMNRRVSITLLTPEAHGDRLRKLEGSTLLDAVAQ